MEDHVVLRLSFEEAYELIDRCVASRDRDTEALQAALLKLTEAVRAAEPVPNAA